MKIIKNYKNFLIYKKKNKFKRKSITYFFLKLWPFIKAIILIAIINFRIFLINKYLNQFKLEKEQEINSKKGEEDFYKYFQSLKNISDNEIPKYRKIILKSLSKSKNRKISSIDTIYFNYYYNFGNMLVALNKAIFYCEILKCKRLLLMKNNKAYIRNNINDEKYNLTIGEIDSSIKIDDDNLISSYYNPFYTFFFNIRPKNRFSLFKNEILRNLPIIKASEDDLYIHIRSGDIFINPILGRFYIQPPLCFYKVIINNNKFNNIHLLTENKLNPVVDKLLKTYPNIIYTPDKLEVDIAKLAYGFNIVGSISSFITGIIKINNNIRKFWEYDIYSIQEKIYHLHHSLYNYRRKYTIYQMSPSKNYIENMYFWRANRKQINLMLKDKCKKKFKVIYPNCRR